jgi:hypothetical protein
MAAKKKTAKKKKGTVKKKSVKRKAAKAIKKKSRTVKRVAGEPMGACRWQDRSGEFQCQSPVTKAFCDNVGGDFTPDDRCP